MISHNAAPGKLRPGVIVKLADGVGMVDRIYENGWAFDLLKPDGTTILCTLSAVVSMPINVAIFRKRQPDKRAGHWETVG